MVCDSTRVFARIHAHFYIAGNTLREMFTTWWHAYFKFVTLFLPLIAVITSYDITLDNYASPSCLKEINIAYSRCTFETADCCTSVNEVVQ